MGTPTSSVSFVSPGSGAFAWFAIALGGTPNQDVDPPTAWRKIAEVGRVEAAMVAVFRGEPVGLIVPRRRGPASASFAFFGLFPWWRGRGMGHKVHAAGLLELARGLTAQGV